MQKIEPLMLGVQQITQATGQSVNVIYDAIKAGHLVTFLVGRRRFANPRPGWQRQAGQGEVDGKNRWCCRRLHGHRTVADRGVRQTQSLRRPGAVIRMTFTARELNKRVTFDALTSTVDPSTGYPTEGWVQVGEASFAKMEPLVGREYLTAAAMQAEGLVKFTIRHRDDIDTTMRLIRDGEAWNMTSIQNVRGRNRENLIYAKRIE